MTGSFALAVLIAGCASLLELPVVALRGAAAGTQEPIAVDGGQTTGTPTIQWTPGVRLHGRPARSWGAYHGSELAFAFNAFPFQDWSWRPVDLRLGEIMSSMWVSVARPGPPSGPGLPKWPIFNPAIDVLMNLGDAPTARPAPHTGRIEFIDEWRAAQRRRP